MRVLGVGKAECRILPSGKEEKSVGVPLKLINDATEGWDREHRQGEEVGQEPTRMPCPPAATTRAAVGVAWVGSPITTATFWVSTIGGTGPIMAYASNLLYRTEGARERAVEATAGRHARETERGAGSTTRTNHRSIGTCMGNVGDMFFGSPAQFLYLAGT